MKTHQLLLSVSCWPLALYPASRAGDGLVTCVHVGNGSMTIMAAQYNTWLLIRLMPRGVAFSFLSSVTISGR